MRSSHLKNQTHLSFQHCFFLPWPWMELTDKFIMHSCYGSIHLVSYLYCDDARLDGGDLPTTVPYLAEKLLDRK